MRWRFVVAAAITNKLAFGLWPLPFDKQSEGMKKILVTGGNKGIGFGVCQTLLESYPDVYILLGARDATRGQAAV